MNEDSKRAEARALAAHAHARGDATGWFEDLYATASCATDHPVGRADSEPEPCFLLTQHGVQGAARSALKVGAGLGDDAEALAHRGFAVTAFDVAPTAVAWAQRRFPRSHVDYRVADVLAPPAEWRRRFDFILESCTLQVLTPALRPVAAQPIVDMLAPAGTLLVIARGRDVSEDEGAMP